MGKRKKGSKTVSIETDSKTASISPDSKTVSISPDSKTASIPTGIIPSPENVEKKKQRRMKYVTDKMTLSRDLFRDEKSFETYQNQFRRMQDSLQVLVDEFADSEIENMAKGSTIATISVEKEQAIGKKIGYKMKLSGRGSLDFAEEIFLPLWLRNTDLTRSQQWTISLRFGLRPHAAAVMNVLKKSKKTKKLQPSTIGRIIEESYNEWAKTFTHRRRLELPTTDEEWENMFHTLKIDVENNRRLLRAIFEETAGVSEDDDSTEEIEADSAQRGFVIIKNVNRDSKLSNIMEFFQNRKIVVNSIEHLLDTRYTPSKKSNTIVIFVENICEATQPSVITNVPANLCYPTNWEVQDKFLCSEP